jgi:hypothetical protein
MRRMLLFLAALSLLLTGCVSLPEGGGVETQQDEDPVTEMEGPFDFTPSGPSKGAPPMVILQDFLLSMQASPQSTAVARKFLTDEAAAEWAPEEATIVYGSKVVTGSADRLRVSLEDTVQLDGRGKWLGPVGGGNGVDYELELVRQRGQWRITNPPDALIIPSSHFESRYQQYFVYYFDPTARVLVPEPVYLPRGEQAPTLLVRRLLRGPDPDLRGVLRTFIPAGTDYVLSVPVSDSGTAEIALSEEFLRLSGDGLDLALAQLGWTLRQLPGVSSMRVTVAGEPLEIPGRGSPQSVSSWTEFDPSIHWASQELFGILDGTVVALSPEGEEQVGQFGAQDYALRDIAVDLQAEQMAGVTEDGSTVVVAPRIEPSQAPPPPGSTREVYAGGQDVLQPSWDVFDQLWLVDRTSAGAVLNVVRDGEALPVRAPGISGSDVTSFLVSRDGTRAVAVVEDRRGDRLVIARVKRTPGGRVRGLTPATELPLAQEGVDEIRDVAWRTPAGLAVLTGPTPGSSQVLVALVDGSAALADLGTFDEVFRLPSDRLVASPSPGSAIYIASDKAGIFELGTEGQWVEADVREGLHVPTFAG